MTEPTKQQKNSSQSAVPWRQQLATRLTLAFQILGILPVLIVTIVLLNRTGTQARDQVYNQLDSVAELKTDQILRWLDAGNLAMDTVLAGPNSERLANFTTQPVHSTQESADVSAILKGAVESEYFKHVFIYDEKGKVLASTNAPDVGESVKDQPYFNVGLHADYIQSPIVDPDSKQLTMYITRPIRSGKIQASGVLVGELNIDTLADIMTERTGLGNSGETYLISLQNNELLTPSRFEGYKMNAAYSSEGINEALKGIKGRGTYDNYRHATVLGSYKFIPELQAALLAEVEQSQALAAYRQAQWIAILIALVFALTGLVIGNFIARSISGPILALTVSARRIGAGDLKVAVGEVRREDEIGVLARAFQQMQSELGGLYEKLEQRVADRTKALTTSSEVSRRLSTILDQKQLVSEVVNQVRDAFGYYHVQIYFYDEARENLVMAGGTGESGRLMLEQFHKLAKGRGLVGRAAENNEPLLVADTTQNPQWLPNPLLPDTRSEVAIPISVGDFVLGVLDVQHNIPDGLQHEDIDALQSIANQIAVAYQNTRSYTETQRNQALLSEALRISRLANWEYDLEKDLFTFNDQFYSLFHTTAEKVGGYKLSSAAYAGRFVYPEDGPIVGAEIQRALVSKERRFNASVDHRFLYENGEIGYMTVSITVERDENGNIVRWYGANQDITERRRLEELNRKRAVQQEAINQITQRIQSASTIEEAMQVAARELGHALGNRQTLVALNRENVAVGNK